MDTSFELGDSVVDNKNKSPLKEIEIKISEPDSILDSNLFENLKNFITFGGSPKVTTLINLIKKDATNLLSTNYHGYCEMIKITTRWMKICGHSDQEIEDLIIENLKSEIFKKFDVKKADSIFLAMNVIYFSILKFILEQITKLVGIHDFKVHLEKFNL
jgi:hypothetical protein